MRDKIFIITLALAILGSFLTGCAKSKPQDDRVLADFGNHRITLSEFKSRLAKIPGYYQNIVDKNKKRFLDEMILEMLLYEEAVRDGLGNDKEVKEVLNEAKKKILIAKLIKTEVEDRVTVSEPEMQRFYQGHREDFKAPEMWRASHILVSDEKTARNMLDQLARGAKFEDLASANSTDATASRGGDIGFFKKGQLVPEFEKACLRLNAGEVSDVVHTQFGYHIIKLTDKKEPDLESYEKARSSIEEILKKKKRSELFDRLVLNLKSKYGVKIREDVFKTLESIDEKKVNK